MKQLAVASFGLKRMTDGMPEIQNAAQALLSFVRGHHAGLQPHGLLDDPLQNAGIATKKLLSFFFEHPEQAGVTDDAALQGFIKSGAIFSIRQSVKHVRVNQNGEGWIERAKQVLAAFKIDGS